MMMTFWVGSLDLQRNAASKTIAQLGELIHRFCGPALRAEELAYIEAAAATGTTEFRCCIDSLVPHHFQTFNVTL
jgi:hypothetical protein